MVSSLILHRCNWDNMPVASAALCTRGSGKSGGKRASGRKKTLKDLGVQRVPSARELFAQDLRKQLPVYSNGCVLLEAILLVLAHSA